MATFPPIGPEPYKALVTALADIIFTTDSKGHMTRPQPSWQTFTGQTFAEYRGLDGLAVLHPDDRELVAEAWQRAVAESSILEVEYRLWHASTKCYRDVAVRGVSVPDSDPLNIQWITPRFSLAICLSCQAMNTSLRRSFRIWSATRLSTGNRIRHR